MKKQKMLPERAADLNDELFWQMLSARSGARENARRLAIAEAKLQLSEAYRREERRAARKELDGMVAFVGVVSCMVVSAVCILAAPIWTAVLPTVGMMAVMRRVGWI